jgi:hypothetical protein
MRHATGYFGVKSAKVYRRVQMGTKPAKVGRLGAPGVLKCGAASAPHPDGRLRKKVFDPCREQSCAKVGAAGGPKLLKWGRLRARQGQIC